jgi:hypothetical protein
MIYAKWSNFKTTYATYKMIATVKEHGVRGLYVLGEGADGYGPLTLQAALKSWNELHPDNQITYEWLATHVQLVENAPRLVNNEELRVFCDIVRPYDPQLVFIDTLGAAAAGQNISLPEVGTLIGANMRTVCHELRADCWVIHHEGKDADRGAMGSQYYYNDTDTVQRCQYDPDAMLLTITAEKARWIGRERQVVYGTRVIDGLTIKDADADSITEFVAVYDLPEGDVRRNMAHRQGKVDNELQTVLFLLREADGRELTSEQLSEGIAGKKPGDDASAEDLAAWKTRRNEAMTLLRSRARTTAAKDWRMLHHERVLSGGEKSVRLWSLPDGDKLARREY